MIHPCPRTPNSIAANDNRAKAIPTPNSIIELSYRIDRVVIAGLEEYLVDGDLAGFELLDLGDNDAQDTVLHAGTDSILVDTSREGERA